MPPGLAPLSPGQPTSQGGASRGRVCLAGAEWGITTPSSAACPFVQGIPATGASDSPAAAEDNKCVFGPGPRRVRTSPRGSPCPVAPPSFLPALGDC